MVNAKTEFQQEKVFAVIVHAIYRHNQKIR